MYTPTLFLCWRGLAVAISPAGLAIVSDVLRGVAGLTSALGFAPLVDAPDQPYAAEGPGPAFTLELRFEDGASLEAAAAGPLAGLASFTGSPPEAQALLGRDFETPDPIFRLAPGQRPCTFLVEYPGTCADPVAWLDHYDAHHPPIMVRFPAIRAVATYRPAPEFALPFPSARAMQRNKVVFDSGEALAAALASPVLADMRADSAKFAAVSARPTHFAMETYTLV